MKKPPYEITPTILKLITLISEKSGEINANYLIKPSPQLRKQNRIKTIHSSLSIEGNTLTEEQITGIIENKPVIGPQKDITAINMNLETTLIIMLFYTWNSVDISLFDVDRAGTS